MYSMSSFFASVARRYPPKIRRMAFGALVVFIVVGLGFLTWHTFVRVQDFRLLGETGVVAQATVKELDCRNHERVLYRFDVGDSVHESWGASCAARCDTLVLNQDVPIRYLPTKPTVLQCLSQRYSEGWDYWILVLTWAGVLSALASASGVLRKMERDHAGAEAEK
jgi:hypothetical protein